MAVTHKIYPNGDVAIVGEFDETGVYEDGKGKLQLCADGNILAPGFEECPDCTVPQRIKQTGLTVKGQLVELPDFNNSWVLYKSAAAYYPLKGNAAEYNYGVLNGTVYGALPTADRFGRVGAALKFDGVDDYVSSNAKFGQGDFTVSFWFKFDELPAVGGFTKKIIVKYIAWNKSIVCSFYSRIS